MATIDEVKQIWKNADAVCFDVDSTLCTDEGLDELAKFAGVYDEVAAWTKKAMSGNVTFQESLQARLEILKGSKTLVDGFLASTSSNFTPGIPEVVKALQLRGTDVYLVSGGFHDLIDPKAKELGIPLENVFANRFKFNDDGEITGFDANEPTSRTGGKARVAEILKREKSYNKLVMIGDGATDMEACPPADAFIGFGGNIVRDSVKAGAKWFLYAMEELIKELND